MQPEFFSYCHTKRDYEEYRSKYCTEVLSLFKYVIEAVMLFRAEWSVPTADRPIWVRYQQSMPPLTLGQPQMKIISAYE